MKRLLLALLAAALMANLSLAGKGNGGGGGNGSGGNDGGDSGPPAVGTIYFDDHTGWPTVSVLAMDADGGNKAPVLPPITMQSGATPDGYWDTLEPSQDTYGGSPIWLTKRADSETEPPELFALRSGAGGMLEELQVTNFNGDIEIGGPTAKRGARWGSSISLDDFISVSGLTSVDGASWLGIFRMEVSAAAIAAAMDAQGAGWTPLTADDVTPIILLEWTLNQQYQANVDFNGHDWSPDGTRLVFAFQELIATSIWSDTLVVYDLLLDQSQDILGGDVDDRIQDPRWSPDGSAIAVNAVLSVPVRKNQVERMDGIWIASPDGSAAAPVELVDAYDRTVSSPLWSPDSEFVVYRTTDRVSVRGNTVIHRHIVRTRFDGSGRTVLTGDLDPLVEKHVLGWR